MTRKQTPATQIEWFLAGCQRIPINGQHWFGHWKKKSPTNKQFWPRNGPIWGQFLGRSFAKWFESGAGAKRAKEHLKCFRPDMFKRRLGHKRQCEGCTIENKRSQMLLDGGRGANNAYWAVFALGGKMVCWWLSCCDLMFSLFPRVSTLSRHTGNLRWAMMKIYRLLWKYMSFDENISALMKIYGYDENIWAMMKKYRWWCWQKDFA